MSDAISAQGTLLARAPAATPFVFTNIAELRNFTPPPMTRKVITTTNHNEQDDAVIVGIRTKGEATFTLGFLPDNATHNELTGLTKAWQDGTKDGYKLTYPDGSYQLFSGYVTNIAPSAPVDDGLTADVTIKSSGGHLFG